MNTHSTHRWSGWPGAWCLNCGQPDLLEEALAGCTECRIPCPPEDFEMYICPIHQQPPCERKDEGLYDPYRELK